MDKSIILRRWSGTVRTERAAEYASYMAETGGDELQTTAGNLGHQITLRDLGDGVTEVCALSWWVDMEAIRAFVGDQPELAHYYTVDEIYLLDQPKYVEHHVVVSGDLAMRRHK